MIFEPAATLFRQANNKSNIVDSQNDAPLRVNFDRQLKRLQQDVLRMGALVEKSCYLARQGLLEYDLEAAGKIRTQDKAIDALYKQIELNCVNIIALQSPVAQDLRLLSAIMQLVRDLERVGDYAKNLGDVALRLANYDNVPHMPRIRIMFDRCRALLATGLEALANLDGEMARNMSDQDDLIDADYHELYTLLTQETQVPGIVEPIVLLVLTIRHLERIADHATNVGKRVDYIVTGER
ncbi:phosphate signaling complex protein PhoU [filamentous cyanobacterium LEGE 11480]|uniref:Phosphate-specific transport system accessory protein PhoU n=1 Tax=Romeriopsis navalis LEGE 11480 TaxID=2777977 RepID=A0A928VMI4_9CYAN|nr:phosphate signaling complex protein PhoU [Romeriopsis navalis LEGE 11480]